MIMIIGGANHPPFDGVLILGFTLAGILMNDCLHSDGHEREGRIFMVAV